MADKCEYCGKRLNPSDEVCPGCGAPNPGFAPGTDASATGEQDPRTIKELRSWCERHNLPLAQMRFFLGENHQGPKAFGIYQDEQGKFVVYKNKADGSRAVRYTGYDEAYAVSQLYEKMKQEIAARKSYKAAMGSGSSRQSTSRRGSSGLSRIWIFGAIALVLIGGSVFKRFTNRHNGYYQYQGDYYYRQGSDWYTYDSFSGWIPALLDTGSELLTDYGDYYVGSDYEGDYDYSDFSDSRYYDSDSGSDSDSSWDWDSDDDWDSDFTDWDSDW